MPCRKGHGFQPCMAFDSTHPLQSIWGADVANEKKLGPFDGSFDFSTVFGDIGMFEDFEGIDIPEIFDLGLLPQDDSARYRKPTLQKAVVANYDNAVDFASKIELREGFREFAFVSGKFIFGDFLEAMSQLGKWEVDRLTIQTLSLSQDNIDSLENVVTMDEPSALHFLISDYWYAHEVKRDGLVHELYDKLDIGDGFRCAFLRTHSKVMTIKTKAGHKIVIHGSANLRSSDNIEQVCIENDPDLYDFCEAFADGILDQYDVVNHNVKRTKRLRSGDAWRAGAARAVAASGAQRPKAGKPTRIG